METLLETLHFLPEWYWVSCVVLFGLIIGSFLNVVIYRVPLEQSIVTPRSACPHCGHKISAAENIPVLSYLLLGGKCRGCKASISIVYPMVELLTATLFLLTYFKYRQQQPFQLWAFLADLLFISACISLVFIDYNHMILPNVITLNGTIVAVVLRIFLPNTVAATPTFFALQFALFIVFVYLVFLALERFSDYSLFKIAVYLSLLLVVSTFILFNTLYIETYLDFQFSFLIFWDLYIATKPWLVSLIDGAIGSVIGAGLLLAMRQVYFVFRQVEGMGLGDVKMLLLVGFYLGWQLTVGTLIMASFLGTILATVFIFRSGREALRLKIPFGVFLGAAAIILTIYGREIVDWYLSHLVMFKY